MKRHPRADDRCVVPYVRERAVRALVATVARLEAIAHDRDVEECVGNLRLTPIDSALQNDAWANYGACELLDGAKSLLVDNTLFAERMLQMISEHTERWLAGDVEWL
jgi:hypothetical protein